MAMSRAILLRTAVFDRLSTLTELRSYWFGLTRRPRLLIVRDAADLSWHPVSARNDSVTMTSRMFRVNCLPPPRDSGQGRACGRHRCRKKWTPDFHREHAGYTAWYCAIGPPMTLVYNILHQRARGGSRIHRRVMARLLECCARDSIVPLIG